MTIRLPRLMDTSLQNLGTVTPLSLSIEMNLTTPSTAVMTLPPDAPAIQPGQFMELFTSHGSAGIFRVEQVERSYPSSARITLAHALVTLSDGILLSQEETTQPAADFFRSILRQQSLWQTGDVSVPTDTLITWRSESASLLEALMALMQALPGHRLTFDQTVTPWKLNLLPLADTCATECRLTRNLRSMTIETDRSDLCTQLYLPGIEEPLCADTISRWGTVSRTLAADAGLTPEELTIRGRQYLDKHKDPQITVTLDALELASATGSSLDSFHLGKLCRICLPEESNALLHRIVTLTYPDVYGAPESVQVSLSNSTRNASTVLAGLIVDTTQVKRQVIRQWNTLQEQKELLIAAEESITLLSKDITLHANELLTLRSGIDDNAASITLLDGRITANAQEISLHAADIVTLRSGVDGNAASITLLDGRITANAQEISLHAADIVALRSGVDSNAASITLLDGRITANAQEIALHANDIVTLRSGVDGNASSISLANDRIAANANAIALKADQSALDLANGRIDAQANEIALKADQSALDLANGRIDAHANEIALKADQSALDLANGRIDAQANEIALKANKIDLQGYVTMTDFEALEGTVDSLWSDQLTVESLSANNVTAGEGDFDSLVFGTIAGKSGDDFVMDIVRSGLTPTTMEVVIGARFSATGAIAVRDAEGTIIGTALTGGRVNCTTQEITFLNYA